MSKRSSSSRSRHEDDNAEISEHEREELDYRVTFCAAQCFSGRANFGETSAPPSPFFQVPSQVHNRLTHPPDPLRSTKLPALYGVFLLITIGEVRYHSTTVNCSLCCARVPVTLAGPEEKTSRWTSDRR